MIAVTRVTSESKTENGEFNAIGDVNFSTKPGTLDRILGHSENRKSNFQTRRPEDRPEQERK